jgi:hypothetical protein
VEQPPAPDDIPALQALWRQAEAAVDFALDPGSALLDWISPNPAIAATVYRRGDEIVGYTRIHSSEPDSPRVFLAGDGETGRTIAAAVARHVGPETMELVLPLHPASAAAAGFVTPSCLAWEAAMALALGPGSLDEYLALTRDEGRAPGRVTWPVAFDV